MLGEIHTTDVVLNTSCFALLYNKYINFHIGGFGGGVVEGWGYLLMFYCHAYHTFKFCMCYNTFKGADRYLEVGGGGGHVRVQWRTHDWFLGEAQKVFFTKGGGQGSRSTLPRTKPCKQHFVLDFNLAPILLHCASANLGKSSYMHATPSASVNHSRVL